jgi:hypothetical protein
MTDDGNKFWRNDSGELHREDGPAIEWDDGSKEWWVNGKLHRDYYPTIERPDGYRGWFRDGKRHREDGPAIENGNSKSWYIDGVELTENEFNARKMAMEIAGRVALEMFKNNKKGG